MRLSILIFLFIIYIIAPSGAQEICSGSLGENIFERGDFGRGTSAIVLNNPNIAPGYFYTTAVPPDGSYTLCSSTGALLGLYPTWIVTGDNSGDPNGYMMVVNASFAPGVFYEEQVEGLCENTLYEFSADILNLIRIGTPNHIDPNVSFLIDGEVVYNTGLIPKTEQWSQYGFSFVTTSTQSELTLTLRNNAPGGGGNDLALDNISFRPCGPSSFIGIEKDTTIFLCIDDDPIKLTADIDGSTGQAFSLQWQISSDGFNWSSIPDSIGNSLTHTNFVPGDYYYRYFSAANAMNILNEKCRIISDVIRITILPDTYEFQDTLCQGLTFDFGSQQLTESGVYVEEFQSQFGCDSIVFLDMVFVPPQPFDFENVTITGPTCAGFEDGLIQVAEIGGGNGDVRFVIEGPQGEIDGTGLAAGDYTIFVEDRFLCTDEEAVTLFDPPVIDVVLEGDTTVLLGDEVELEPEYSMFFDSIEWVGMGTFDCENCQTSIFVPYFSGTVSVIATDDNGCSTSDSITISVDEQNFVSLPNIFSPNDDRINDFFTIHFYGRSVSSILSFRVYDRWGGLVHNTENVAVMNGDGIWDGFSGANRVANGVYVYQLKIQLINNKELTLLGNVTVLR